MENQIVYIQTGNAGSVAGVWFHHPSKHERALAYANHLETPLTPDFEENVELNTSLDEHYVNPLPGTENEKYFSVPVSDPNDFEKVLSAVLNFFSKDTEANTPDFILASHANRFLSSLSEMVKDRDRWFGFLPFGADGSSPPSVQIPEDKDS